MVQAIGLKFTYVRYGSRADGAAGGEIRDWSTFMISAQESGHRLNAEGGGGFPHSERNGDFTDAGSQCEIADALSAAKVAPVEGRG